MNFLGFWHENLESQWKADDLGGLQWKLGLSNEMAKQILWTSMNLFGCSMKILGFATKLWSLNKKLRVSNDNPPISLQWKVRGL